MNLSARKFLGAAGLLLSLFNVSCEDPGKIGLNVDPKQGPMLTKYHEFLLPSAEVQFDPRSTVSSSSFQAGSYTDPDFGTITSKSFAWLGVQPSLPSLSETAAYDSLTVSVKFSSVYGGETLDGDIETLDLYQLGEKIDTNQVYTRISDVILGQKLGSLDLYLQDNDTLHTDSTFVFRLNNTFGQALFDKLKANDGTYESDAALNDVFKGIALVPSGTNSRIIQLSSSSVFFNLAYHEINVSGESITRTYTFDLSGMRFYHITSDLSGTPLAGLQPNNQDFIPSSDYRYMQSGTMIALKVDFSDFFQFAVEDSNKNMVIQRAQLKVGGLEENVIGSEIPGTLRGYFTDDSNIWPATKTYESATDTVDLFVTLQEDSRPAGSYLYTQSIGLNAQDTTRYEASMSTFLQDLYRGKFDSEETPYEPKGKLFLFTPTASDFPQSSSSHVFTNHFKVHKDSIRLELYYSVPNNTKN